MWLTGRLSPDFKTIADFRKDHGEAIRKFCREFVMLCRQLKLFTDGIVAIDGSKFKVVNNRDKNFTGRKLQARMQQLEDSIKRYLVDSAEPTEMQRPFCPAQSITSRRHGAGADIGPGPALTTQCAGSAAIRSGSPCSAGCDGSTVSARCTDASR
jgi:hypothetical protein